MREKAKGGIRTFALTADAAEAHRQIPTAKSSATGIYLPSQPRWTCVCQHCTFGVASASYYWSRVTAAFGKLSQYLVVERAQIWHILVADDYHLESGGEAYRSALFVLFILCPRAVLFHYHGTKLPEALWSLGLGLSSCTTPFSSASQHRVVHSLDTGGFEIRLRKHDRLQTGPWPCHVCRECIGVRVHVPPSQRCSPASPSLCFHFAFISFPIGCPKSSPFMRRRIATVLLFTTSRRSSEFD